MTYKDLILLLCIFFMGKPVSAQVIYERTYPNNFPSLKNTIELSDLSTVSFSKNSTCDFAGYRHISPTGSIIDEGGLAGESTHSFETEQTGKDSILVSCRVGPLDFPGANYFQVVLWTPDTITTLVVDTVQYNYWEDYEWGNTPIRYDAFLIHDHHLLYQRGDTVFSKNLITGNVDYKETFTYLYNIYPVQDGIIIYWESNPPTYFNSRLEQIKTLPSLNSNPFAGVVVSLDSFLVGRNFGIPTSLHAVNAFNENSRDIDLSAYFSQIDSIVVRGDVLIATGLNGGMRYALQLDKDFEIISGSPYVLPDDVYPWILSIYPDRIYAWRIDGLSGYGADYRIAYSYLDPQPITYVDIALVDITVDSVDYYDPPSPGAPVILKLSANIVNRSADTLHNFTMHYQEDPFQMCDPGVYPSHYYNLETPPGDTAVVKRSLLVWPSETSMPIIRTFYVQHGNHHLDSNRVDNSFRLNYLITSAEEPVRAAVSVYPNPFTDFLRLYDIAESSQLILYDQTGRFVSNGYGELNNLGHLPIGIYVLQVNSGHSISVTRVVKVE